MEAVEVVDAVPATDPRHTVTKESFVVHDVAAWLARHVGSSLALGDVVSRVQDWARACDAVQCSRNRKWLLSTHVWASPVLSEHPLWSGVVVPRLVDACARVADAGSAVVVGDVVVDLGCGLGMDVAWLGQWVPCLGVDRMVQLCDGALSGMGVLKPRDPREHDEATAVEAEAVFGQGRFVYGVCAGDAMAVRGLVRGQDVRVVHVGAVLHQCHDEAAACAILATAWSLLASVDDGVLVGRAVCCDEAQGAASSLSPPSSPVAWCCSPSRLRHLLAQLGASHVQVGWLRPASGPKHGVAWFGASMVELPVQS